MGLKVFSVTEFLVVHILLIAGLVLVTIGLLQGNVVLNIIGIWAIALGFCTGFIAAFRKVLAK